MAQLSDVPDWPGTAVVAAVLAAVGYVAKLLIELIRDVRRSRAEKRARLLELASLLRATRVLFLVQNQLAVRLAEALRSAHPDAPSGSGYEDLFATQFDTFTPDQKALHEIIRGITEHSLRPLNKALSKWLRKDLTFRTGYRAKGDWRRLAEKLGELETHLLLWHAKYDSWIPGEPRHALVYLADEQQHGIAFPEGLDDLVGTLVGRQRRQLGGNPRHGSGRPPG